MKSFCLTFCLVIVCAQETLADGFPAAQEFVAPNMATVQWVRSSPKNTEKREALASSFSPALGFSAISQSAAAKRFELRQERVNVLLRSSKEALSRQRFEQAAQDVAEAKQLSPNALDVLLQEVRVALASCQTSKSKPANELLSTLHKAFAIDKDNVETLYLLAETHRLIGENSDALFFYNLVLSKPIASDQKTLHRRSRYWRNQL